MPTTFRAGDVVEVEQHGSDREAKILEAIVIDELPQGRLLNSTASARLCPLTDGISCVRTSGKLKIMNRPVGDSDHKESPERLPSARVPAVASG